MGSLFIVPFDPSRCDGHIEEVEALIDRCHIGGVITKATRLGDHVSVLNRLQKRQKKDPLLVSIDAEWGLAMRMRGCTPLLRNMTMGALIDRPDILFELGQEVAHQVRSVGASLLLGPVVDVNTNPRNPVIHTRSFGDDPYRVSMAAMAYLKGVGEVEGVTATLKHYPGHGDVEIDSHWNLPASEQTMEELTRSHLIPFEKCLASGGSHMAVMSAHIAFPNIDGEIATFSRALVFNTIRKKWGFKGLIITDALNMKALTQYYSPEEIAVRALKAGHDILLYGDHLAPNIDEIIRDTVPRAYAAVLDAVRSGEISIEELDARVERIMAHRVQASLPSLQVGENSFKSSELQSKLASYYGEAMTVVGKIPLFRGEKGGSTL